MDESNQNMNNAPQNNGATYNPQGGQPNMGQPQNNGATYNPQGNGATYNPQGAKANGAAYNPQGGAQYAPNGAAYSAPKKPINKDLLLLIISAVAALVCIIVFFVVGNSSFGAENCAKKFYYSLNTNHPGDAFEMLDVSDDEFVNKTAFEESYGLTSDDISIYEEKGFKDMQVDTSFRSDHKSAEVYITSSTYTEFDSISIVVKRDGNIFGIFPNWKVDASNIIAKKIEFSVPKGATLTIDDKEVDTKYIDKDLSDDDNDVYVIPKMLKGYCKASASIEGFDVVPETTDIYDDGDSVTLEYSAPDESVLQDVSKQYYDAFSAAITAAKDGKDFSEVESSLNADGDTSDMKDHYDDLVDGFAEDATQPGITSIETSNVKVTARYESYDALPTISLDLTADMTVHHNAKDWDTEALSDVTDTDDIEIYADYVFKDGKWVLDAENSYLLPYIYVSDWKE